MDKKLLRKTIFNLKYGKTKEVLFYIGFFLLALLEVVAVGNLAFDAMRWLDLLN